MTRAPTVFKNIFILSMAFLLAFSVMPQASAQDTTPGAAVMAGGNDELGAFLVAANGLTLYTFDRDEAGVSNCYDTCAENWPPLTVEEDQDPASAADLPGILGITVRDDGSRQVTYDDMPLYFWVGDTAPGEATGHGVGDVWWVVPLEAMAEEEMVEEEMEATPTPVAEEEMAEEEMEATPTPAAEEEMEATPTPVAEEEMAEEEMEATPTPVAEEEITEEERQALLDQFTPSLEVRDQVLDGSNVTVPEVFATEDGWMVIHLGENDEPGPVLGYTAVPAGYNVRVTVTLEQPVPDGTQLWAMLHVDAGEAGVYEFPGADIPATLNDEVVMKPFFVLTPDVRVEDQVVEDNRVVISAVVAAEDGWLVIHESNADGSMKVPDSIGHAPIAPGTTPNVVVELETEVEDGARLWAMLHVDLGEKGAYEFPGPDVPVTLDDSVVVTPFRVVAEGMEGAEMEEGEEQRAVESLEAPAALPVTGSGLPANNATATRVLGGVLVFMLVAGAFMWRRHGV